MFSNLQKKVSSSLSGFNEDVFAGFDDLFTSMFSPLRTDIQTTNNGYEIQVDVPGVSKEDIEIQAQNDTLTLNCKRSDERKIDKNPSFFSCERKFGKMSRSWVLPGMDKSSISATVADGVLTIKLNKRGNETDKVTVKIT